MSAFKEIYDVLKDLLSLAKKAKNQEMVKLATDIQAGLFDLKEEIENVKDENKELKEKLNLLEQSNIEEKDLIFSTRGFILKKNENPPIPYCSYCWKTEHKLLPLHQRKNWYNFECSNCRAEIVVMTNDGQQLGHEKETKNET